MDTLASFKDSLVWLSPAISLILGGCLLLAAPVVFRGGTPVDASGRRNGTAAFALIVLLVAVAFSCCRSLPTDLGSGLFRFDATALAAERLTLLGGLLLLLTSWANAPRHFLGEYYGCLLIMLGAIPVVGAANDLIALFVGLELVSIPTYVLLAISKNDNAGAEATLKYFMLSAFSSTFFLLGLSYLFGVTGSTNLQVVQAGFAGGGSQLLILAVVLVMCGMAFRITAFPFHFYAPDVFAGTSLSVAAMMSFLPKLVGFVALVRVLDASWLADNLAYLVPILLVGGVVTMLVGNFLALAQENLRRLLAYSSVAHSGYLLLALAAMVRGDVSAEAVFAYLAAYAAMTLGLFAALTEVEEAGGDTQRVDSLGGLFYRRPAASVALVVCLVSMIGLPLTAGFWAKFFVFTGITASGLSDSWSVVAAIAMAFNAAIATAYYWRVLTRVFERREAHLPKPVFRLTAFMAYSVGVALTLVWFFAPPL